jgi:hypothetical protein
MHQPVSAKVINWEKAEGLYGVWVQYPNGRHHSYVVGSRAEAEAEAKDVMRVTRIRLVQPDGRTDERS